MPEQWTKLTPVPDCLDRWVASGLNGDLLDCALLLESGLNRSNRDKASLVKWQGDLPPIPVQTVEQPAAAAQRRWFQFWK